MPIIHRTVEPGQTIRLGYSWFHVRAPGWKGPALAPTLVAQPGRYAVYHTGFPVRHKGTDSDPYTGATGRVEFEVTKPFDGKETQARIGDTRSADTRTDGWGDAVEGLQCRLHADKAAWKAGELPTFKLDVRDLGKRNLEIHMAQDACQLEFDGRWFAWQGPVSIPAGTWPAGRHYEDFEVRVSLGERWTSDTKPIELTPGQHKVRVAYITLDRHQPVRAVSNAVAIRIEAPARTKGVNDKPAAEGTKEQKPRTPEDAIKLRSDDQVTVEFRVQSVVVPQKPFVPGGRLSESIDKRFFELKHDEEFGVAVVGAAARHIYRLGIEPEAYFAGKVARVSGQILTYRNPTNGRISYRIRVESIDDLEIAKKHGHD